MMKQLQSFDGVNTELTEKFNSFSGKNISAKTLKQLLRYYLNQRVPIYNLFIAYL
jgi:hypothetical protein